MVIDFHQDAYSKEIGEDGAPLWAIQPPPPPEAIHEGPLTNLEQLRTSLPVLKAFVSFFVDDDADTTDVQLQAAFVAMVKHVAARFVDEPYVLGYDLYNEPTISDPYVWRFHDRVVAGLRQVDQKKIVFFEPSVLRAMSQSAPTNGAFPDPLAAYAPHIYTYMSEPELADLTKDELVPNVTNAVKEAKEWQTPLFVGEWGLSAKYENGPEYLRYTLELFDANNVSATVWLWKEASQGQWGFFDWDEATDTYTERPIAVATLSRPYPQIVAGTPKGWIVAADRSSMTLTFTGRGDLAPHVVYLSDNFAGGYAATCDGKPIDTPARDAATGLVELLCLGGGEHTLVVTAK